MKGHVDGREIDVLTINTDETPEVLFFGDGIKICLRRGKTKFTPPGNHPFFAVPGSCRSLVITEPCARFSIPAKEGCLS